MVGRAATLPLVQRPYRDSQYSFSEGSELHHTLLFFDALLPNLPPRNPSLLAGRRVNHFIENKVALSALAHGYSGKPELTKAVTVFYLQMISLRASVYFDYGPSKAT